MNVRVRASSSVTAAGCACCGGVLEETDGVDEVLLPLACCVETGRACRAARVWHTRRQPGKPPNVTCPLHCSWLLSRRRVQPAPLLLPLACFMAAPRTPTAVRNSGAAAARLVGCSTTLKHWLSHQLAAVTASSFQASWWRRLRRQQRALVAAGQGPAVVVGPRRCKRQLVCTQAVHVMDCRPKGKSPSHCVCMCCSLCAPPAARPRAVCPPKRVTWRESREVANRRHAAAPMLAGGMHANGPMRMGKGPATCQDLPAAELTCNSLQFKSLSPPCSSRHK